MSWIMWMTVFGISLGVFLLVMIGMAVGVMLSGKSLKGSCGGLANPTSADGTTSCSLCTNPDAACRELKRRSKNASRTDY